MNDGNAAAAAKADAGVVCESRWGAYQAQVGRDVAALKARWLEEREACGGTGTYEYHLATLAELEGDFDGAISILKKAIRDGVPHKEQLYITGLGMEFNKADAARPRDMKGAKAASARLETFLLENPSVTPAVHILASQKARLREYAAAEKFARQGLAADPTNGLSLSALVVSLAATDRCSNAKTLIQPALEKNEILFEDYDFMMAAAFCYYDTGDLLTAEHVLRTLKAKLPGSEREQSFQRLSGLVAQAKASQGPK